MIKLIFIHTDPPHEYLFQQPRIIIGSEGDCADLIVREEGLATVHVTIEEKKCQFFIINNANDPFVSLNGLPFGKHLLFHGDCIQIRHHSLRFEAVIGSDESSLTLAAEGQEESSLKMPLDANTEQQQLSARECEKCGLAIPTEDRAEQLLMEEHLPLVEALTAPQTDANYTEIEELFRQVDSLEELTSPQEEQRAELESPEAQEEKEGSLQPIRMVAQISNRLCRWIVAAVLLLTVLLALFFSDKFYADLKKQVQFEEISAAEGAADIAMALAYAQMHQIQPQNHNWSDPSFLYGNLASILPPSFHDSMTWKTSSEENKNTYALRIYTSDDLTRFLVIIQPKPSVMQWLAPRAAIAIDSHEMVLRKTTDFRGLNRLLLQPDLFHRDKSHYIGELLQQCEIISVEYLAQTSEEHGQYLPPKALGLICPGAEKKIYNAPRYYLFSNALMEKLSALFALGELEVSVDTFSFQREAEQLSPLPDMVFYSAYGIQDAYQMQELLHHLNLKEQIFTAYLRFNAQGRLLGSHLLIGKNSDSSNKAEKGKIKESLLLEQIATIVAQARLTLKNEIAILQESLQTYVEDKRGDIREWKEQQEKIEALYASYAASFAFYREQIIQHFQSHLAANPSCSVEDVIALAEEIGLEEWARNVTAVRKQGEEI